MHAKTIRKIILTLLIVAAILANVSASLAVTWSQGLNQLTTYSQFDGAPSTIQTKDGHIWVVWTRNILGNLTLFYKTSSDLGNTWSPATNLTKELAPGDNSNPSIIQLANGTIMLVWASNKLPPPPPPPPEPDFSIDASPKTLTIPQGATDNSTIIVTSLRNFSESVKLSVRQTLHGVDTTLNPTQVTPPQNGTANSTLTVSVNATATPGQYALAVLGKSSTKSHEVNIALEITLPGAAAPSRISSFYSSSSSSEEDYEIHCRKSNDNGATWSKVIQLTNNTYDDLDPAIVQLANGTIMVVWESEKTAGNPDIFCKTTSDGISWSDETRLTSDALFDEGPSVILAKDGRIWLAWCSDRTGDFEIYYKTYDGSSWSGITRLTNSIKSDICPSILQTLDETMWIFWSSREDDIGATMDIYYKTSTDNGDTWSDSIQFTTDPNDDTWPSTMRTHDTKIWVTWTSNRGAVPDGNWEIYYRTSLAGDVNEDGIVDIFDLSLVSLAYGCFEGEPGYNPGVDLNKDGVVDMRDLTIVALNYGAT